MEALSSLYEKGKMNEIAIEAIKQKRGLDSYDFTNLKDVYPSLGMDKPITYFYLWYKYQEKNLIKDYGSSIKKRIVVAEKTYQQPSNGIKFLRRSS